MVVPDCLEEQVYAYFGMTGLYCFAMDGNPAGEKDLGNFPMQSNWGTSTSPLLYNNVVYMQIDNEENSFLAALDSKTGKELWRVDRDEKSNWGTPVIWKNSVRTERVTEGKKSRLAQSCEWSAVLGTQHAGRSHHRLSDSRLRPAYPGQ